MRTILRSRTRKWTRELLVERNVAGASLQLGASQPHNRVLQIAKLAFLDAKHLPSLPSRSESAGDVVTASVHGAFDGGRTRGLPFDLGIESLGHGCQVPPVEGFNDLPHDLHVLLRHRLLRKPGGFEGFLAARVLLHPPDLSGLEADDAEESVVNPCSGITSFEASAGKSFHRHHSIVGVDDLLGFDPIVGKQIGKRVEEPRDLTNSLIGARPRRDLELDLRMPDFGEARPIPRIAGEEVTPARSPRSPATSPTPPAPRL